VLTARCLVTIIDSYTSSAVLTVLPSAFVALVGSSLTRKGSLNEGAIGGDLQLKARLDSRLKAMMIDVFLLNPFSAIQSLEGACTVCRFSPLTTGC
jgi:hypothetical protein